MADLFGTNGQAIMMGNAHMSQVRDLNDRIRQHNQDVTDRIQGLRDQQSTLDNIKEIKDTASTLWTAKDIPGKVKEYNQYFTDRAAGKAVGTNPAQNTVNRLRARAGEDPANLRNAMSEGQVSREAGREVTAGVENADKTVVKGLAKDGEELLNKTKLGAIAEKAGVLGSAAAGGLDLYEDIKAGKIQGNNTWEKASNILQIGGSAADLVGTFFPPAKLVGGLLDLSSGVTDLVGEKLEDEKKGEDLKKQEEQETISPSEEQAPVQQTVATGRTQ